MKIIPPPQITDLDGLLDVVLHPEKLASCLKQMKDMRDAITERLGVYATKEQAEDYLSQAQSQFTKAAETLKLAQVKQTEIDQQCQAQLEQLRQDQHAWTQQRDQEQARLTSREQDLAVERDHLLQQQREVNERQNKLDEQDAVHARLSARLSADQEKMDRKKALLSAIG